jgi:hypothetical protein
MSASMSTMSTNSSSTSSTTSTRSSTNGTNGDTGDNGSVTASEKEVHEAVKKAVNEDLIDPRKPWEVDYISGLTDERVVLVFLKNKNKTGDGIPGIGATSNAPKAPNLPFPALSVPFTMDGTLYARGHNIGTKKKSDTPWEVDPEWVTALGWPSPFGKDVPDYDS